MDDQKNRRGGAVDKINSAINSAQNLKSVVKIGRTLFSLGRTAAVAASTSEIWIPVVVIAVVFLIILLTLFMLLGGSSRIAFDSQGGSGGSGGPIGGGNPVTDISTCSFYRGGDAIQGLKFGNQEMANFVSEVSIKVGVPPAIVAGIMRVESADRFSETDPAYFENDYDDHSSSSGCCFGLMQFNPDTFTGVFTRNKSEMKNLFGKDNVTTAIDPPDNIAPANILRIYSIRDSIITTAFKVKDDKQDFNGDGPWNLDAVNAIIGAYYGCLKYPSCSTGPNDYGEDVWNSYVNCQASSSFISSCPIKGTEKSTPYISCGSFMSSPQFNLSACAGLEPKDRGHCGRSYGVCFKDTIEATNDQRRAHSIDVPAAPGTPVYLPTLNNQAVTWNYEWSFLINEDSGGGYGYEFTATTGTDRWYLRLLHLNGPTLNPFSDGSNYKSGDVVSSIAATSFPHVHINIGKNPTNMEGGDGWLNPEDLGMCTQ